MQQMTDCEDDEVCKAQITKALQSIMDTIQHDVMVDSQR